MGCKWTDGVPVKADYNTQQVKEGDVMSELHGLPMQPIETNESINTLQINTLQQIPRL